jgi:uncharacterized delta-60 repeat protein
MKLIRALLVIVALGSANPVKSQSFYLDQSFGNGGSIADLSITPNSRVNDLEVQSDGKIVGILYNNMKFQVFRLKTTGAPDSSFGLNGFVEVQLTTNFPNLAVSLALQPDGKILVAGIVNKLDDDIALLRFDTDGSPDKSFGTSGVVTTGTYNYDDEVQKMLLKPDGKIIVAARRIKTGEKTREELMQFNDDGSIDFGFGNNGMVIGSYSGNETNLESAALQSDGKILTTGYTYVGQVSNSDVFVSRYNTDGSVDMGFGTDGKVIKDYVSAAKEDGRKILVQSTGKIVVACYAPSLSFMTFRLNEDGTDDKRYGNKGVSSLNLNLSDFSFDAILVGRDEILIGGNVDVAGVYDFNIARLDKNGNNKYTFGMNGKITTDVFGYTDYLFSLAQQRDGKIIAAGSSIQSLTGLPYPSVVRYVANPVNGVEEVEPENTLQVYPNPAKGAITIKGKEATDLLIYTINGQLTRKIELNYSNNFSVTINDLQQGLFVIRDVNNATAGIIEIQ